ncbi:MAG: prolipoprotein diacylglyceryl transferase [Pirellulales bacterium]|nr:prolipoprotein diacylglyceryl transferase [Pirellulales bacterium]
MQQTLLFIPRELSGIPLFGFGWLLAVWAVFSVIVLVRAVRRQGWTPDTWGWLPVLLLVGAAIGWLGPRLIQPQGLPIRGFGTMLLLAIVSAVALATWRARRSGWDPEVIYSLAFWVCIAGILGARIFYIVEYWEDFRAEGIASTLADLLNIAQGGIVFYGSVIGGAIAALVFVRLFNLPTLALGDLIAPSVALGIGLGRVGCFLNGCCYGGVTDLPWAVRFPEGSPAHMAQVKSGQAFLEGLKLELPYTGPAIVRAIAPGSPAAASGLQTGEQIVEINGVPIRETREAWQALLRAGDAGATLQVRAAGRGLAYTWKSAPRASASLPVHPTQLYSVVGGTLICLFLLAYEPLRRRDGELLAWLATLYPIERFLVEILRDDESAIWNTGLTVSQNISLALFLVGLGLWLLLRTRPLGSVRALTPAV